MITKETKDQYYRDPEFAPVVKALYHLIKASALSPEEMRQALQLATYQFHMEHVKPIFVNEKGKV